MLTRIAVQILLLVTIASGSCPNGFIHRGSSCYHFSHDKEDWTDARAMCKMMGSDLVEIGDAGEDNFIQAQIKLNDKYYWVGGNDIAVENDWVWATSGRSFSSYSHWAPGEPSNNGGYQNCLRVGPGVGWNDMACNLVDTYYYICEKPFEQAVVVG